jgi:hypothetical protein
MSIVSRPTMTAGLVFGLFFLATSSAAQTMEAATYFQDSIAEKGDQNFIIRLNGGSSWLLASRTSALVNTDLIVVLRDVVVEGKPVRAAWMFVGGEEIPARHLEGVYPTSPAFLSRVVAAEDQGTKLRLADGTSLLVPGYNKFISNRWRLPYKVLLTDNRLTLYHLLDGRRISVEPVK